MTKRIFTFLLVLLVVPAIPSAAERPSRRPHPGLDRDREGDTRPASSRPAQERALVRVLAWLHGEPLAELHARTQPPLPGLFQPLRIEGAALQEQRAALRAGREQVRRRLEALGFVSDGETDVALHTLIGRMPEESIAAAGAIPGVRMVRRVRVYEAHLDGAIPTARIAALWPLVGGESEAGRGIKIGIIDTGIDIANPMLKDATLAAPSGYPRGQTEFTNTKVIVARSYVAMLGDPRDPPDAMDREGHGTFIAGIAAGRRAAAPLASIAGVAPRAYLGNYRIYASPLAYSATTDAAIIAAVNDAVADGMNVINFSSGILPGDLPEEEPVPQAMTAAVRAGVVIVASAGNLGWTASVSDPAIAPEIIAVGATNNSRVFGNLLKVVGPEPVDDKLKRMATLASTMTKVTAPIGPVTVLFVTNACSPPTVPDLVRQKAVLVSDDSDCSRSTMVRTMAEAGATLVIIARADDSDPVSFSLLSNATSIPSFQVSRTDGNLLAAAATPEKNTQISIEAGIQAIAVPTDRMTLFSSRGPSFGGLVKPDLVAPGQWMYSAYQVNDSVGVFYSLEQFGTGQGTSFSAPLVAGVAALLRQAHSTWTPAQVQSALVNTAAAVVTEGAQSAPVLATGAGRLDAIAANAATASFVPVSISFGSHVFQPLLAVQRSFTVTNTGTAAETFAIDARARTEISGATMTIEPATTRSLSPGESQTVTVLFTAPAVAPTFTDGAAATDGRLRVRGNSSAKEYQLAYWGQIVAASRDRYMYPLRGDGQTGPIGTTLPRRLAVQIRDIEDIPTAGVTVKFKVTNGTGTLSGTEVVTDTTGQASVTLRLGDVPGPVDVLASTDSDEFEFWETARPAPATSSAGVVNAASYTAGISPGGIISIFGTGLAAGNGSAASIPLPRLLASAQVIVNGVAAPLFYVSPSQINAQAPYEIAGLTSAQLRVIVAGVESAPVTVPVSSATPGIFTTTQDGKGSAVLLHGANYAPVSAANPARPGEALVLYTTGLGAVQPPVPTGEAGPAQPATTTIAPTVRVGGQDARVLFSGLAPTFVGLYQVNFEVPASVSGDAVALTLTIGQAGSNGVTLPIRQQ